MARWATGITRIVKATGMGTNPASVNRRTGVLYLNADLAGHLSKDQLFFILLHEMGHVVLQSTNEEEVDAWAHKIYMQRGYKLSESVKVLTKIFRKQKKGITQQDWHRMVNQLRRAQRFDGK